MVAWTVLRARVPLTKVHGGGSGPNGWNADVTIGNPHARAHVSMRDRPSPTVLTNGTAVPSLMSKVQRICYFFHFLWRSVGHQAELAAK